MTLQLVIGLGNPGPEYASTRHNAGAWFIDAISKQYAVQLKLDKKRQGALAKLPIPEISCYAFIPNQFMNLSGQSVQSVMQFFHLSPASTLVAHDDLDLPAGSIKLKLGGGSGGHNGIKSLIQHLPTPEFYRLKIGIGHPRHHSAQPVHDYVLHAPSHQDQHLIDEAIARAVSVFPLMVRGEWAQAMQQLHT